MPLLCLSCCRQGSGNAPKYSRLDTEISAMQRNSSTYCDQPEDAEDFATWLQVSCPDAFSVLHLHSMDASMQGGEQGVGMAQAFNLDSKKADIETIIKDNAFMAELQSRIVPLIVQYDVFWTRYFYQCASNLPCGPPCTQPSRRPLGVDPRKQH